MRKNALFVKLKYEILRSIILINNNYYNNINNQY